jgi:hypothetical protein
MDITVQDGRAVIITDLMLGLDASPDATEITVSTIPTIGNIFKDGVEMVVSDTILLSEIRADSLTFETYSGTLGDTSFAFNADAVEVNITIILGAIGTLYIMAKTVPARLSLGDTLPREIPALLANKLAHEVAARVLERGDRRSDDQMAVRARQKFMEAKLATIASINNFGGSFDSVEAI